MPPRARPTATAAGVAAGKKSKARTPSSSDGGGKSNRATSTTSGSEATTATKAPPLPDGRELWMATDALQKTSAMRDYFQLERDRIVAFTDVTRKQLDEATEQLREMEQALAEQAERHEVEKRVFMQKIRHVLYENQVQLSTYKEEAERTRTAKEELYRQLENNARRDIRDVKLLDRELDDRQREQQQALVTQQDKEIAEQQAEFEREVREMHMRYEGMLRDVRDDMDRARRDELRQLEARKDAHVAELREAHERTFKEIKDYYSEITSNNLEMIRTLKDEVYARKRTEAHNEKAMLEVAQRNKKLTRPLESLQRQKKELEAELTDYAATRSKLEQLKTQVADAEQARHTLAWEHEVLTQRYAKLVEDRDIILGKYNTMLQKIQQKATFRRVLVQKKLELVQTQLEGKDAQLTELLKRANINAEDLQALEQKVHDLLSEKDKTIEDLKRLLVHMTERGEDVVATYEAYLANNGVSGLVGGNALHMS